MPRLLLLPPIEHHEIKQQQVGLPSSLYLSQFSTPFTHIGMQPMIYAYVYIGTGLYIYIWYLDPFILSPMIPFLHKQGIKVLFLSFKMKMERGDINLKKERRYPCLCFAISNLSFLSWPIQGRRFSLPFFEDRKYPFFTLLNIILMYRNSELYY